MRVWLNKQPAKVYFPLMIASIVGVSLLWVGALWIAPPWLRAIILLGTVFGGAVLVGSTKGDGYASHWN